VVEALAADGAMVGLHVCGDATRIVGDMVTSGSQLLAVDDRTDRAAGKAAARGRTALIGTVDPSGIHLVIVSRAPVWSMGTASTVSRPSASAVTVPSRRTRPPAIDSIT
jgi:hypothetical protein